MISYLDHLRTQARLLYDADFRRVWPQVKEQAGRPRLHIQFKVLQCERLSGAEIKRRYQWPPVVPDHLKALNDMDRYISVLVLLTKTYTGRTYGCVKGVFDLRGAAVVLMSGQVFSPATLQSLHFWHQAPETRWTSRQDMVDDLAERIRAVVAGVEAWLRKHGFAEDSIGLTRTKALLSGLEAGVPHEELVFLLGCFESSMMGYTNEVLGMEEHGMVPPEFAERTYDLMRRLRGVRS